MYGKEGGPFARPLPDHMQGVDIALADEMARSLNYSGDTVTFADIAGLAGVKRLLREAVVCVAWRGAASRDRPTARLPARPPAPVCTPSLTRASPRTRATPSVAPSAATPWRRRT
jgi:hypothetical protein